MGHATHPYQELEIRSRTRRTAAHFLGECAAAIVLGAVSSFAASLLRLGFRGLQWCLTHNGTDPPHAAASLPPWHRFLIPIVGALLAILILYLRRKNARRLGREPRHYVEYVEAVRHEHGHIPLVPNLWRTGAAAFSVASGAAIGREGSMIQFAAAVTSWFQERLRKLRIAHLLPSPALAVACGVAGGVTTAYMAPIAGLFFATEIVLGEFCLDQMLQLALAAAAGYGVSAALLGSARLYPTHVPLHFDRSFWPLPLLAIAIGAFGPVYQWLLRSLRKARRLPLALAVAGALCGALSLLDPRVWGNGDAGLSAALGHNVIPGLSIGVTALATLFGLRMLATMVCVGVGTVGGVFTPTLFTGGALGALAAFAIARLTHMPADPVLWAIVGMSAMIAAATHAPLMAAFMAVELTGDWGLLPLLLVLNAFAWLLAHRLSKDSLYAIASQTPIHRGLPPPRRLRLTAKPWRTESS
jgi:chloride channel protein, CIC family